MSYQHVNTSEDERCTKDLCAILGGGRKEDRAHRCKPDDFDSERQKDVLDFRVSPESVRFLMYVIFWGMTVVAMLLTKFYTAEQLLAGPKNDVQANCPPFNVASFPGAETVDRTNGFDIDTENHLLQVFGYTHVCVYFDYTPSREVAAFIWAFSEYMFIAYIVADFILAALSHMKGYVSERYWKLAKVMFPIQITFCTIFRMIFVIPPEENISLHTLGFCFMQLCLVSIAIMNAYYVLETKVSYEFLGGPEMTRKIVKIFLIIEIVVSLLSVFLNSFVIFEWGVNSDGSGYIYPEWAKVDFIGSWSFSLVVNNLWTLVISTLPLFIAYIRSKSEPALLFKIDMEEPHFLE